MDFHVLGPVAVRQNGESLPLKGRQQRLVLALLLAADGNVVSVDAITDGIWGDDPPATSRKTLQVYWNLDDDSWYDVACQAAGRNMTRAEWEQFGPRDAEYRATCPQYPIEGQPVQN